MTHLLQQLKPIDLIMFFLILGAGLMLIGLYKKPKEKEGLKATKPRKDEIRRADILDAKLSYEHEAYLQQARMNLDEHEQAIAG